MRSRFSGKWNFSNFFYYYFITKLLVLINSLSLSLCITHFFSLVGLLNTNKVLQVWVLSGQHVSEWFATCKSCQNSRAIFHYSMCLSYKTISQFLLSFLFWILYTHSFVFFFFFFLFYFLTTRTSILWFLIEAISCVLLSLGIFIFFILNLVHIYTYTLTTVCFFLQIRDVIHMPKISSSPNHTLDYISKG